MDKEKNIQRIKRLSNENGISGFEDSVLSLLRKEGEGLGSFSEDSLRNLYLERKRNKEGRLKVQLDAHSDEVGFMVKAVRPDGMIEFIPIGGWVPFNIPAHMVRIKNRNGDYLSGIVASKPPHFLSEEEQKKPLSIDSMVIDVGARSAEEIENVYNIDIGAPITPEAICSYDEKNDILMGKAFDNRLGCAAVLSTLEELSENDLQINLVGVFAAQEEVGTRGEYVCTNRISPDLAIIFEGCPADDTVVPEYRAQTVLKKGPMLRHIDARMITNPRFQRYAIDLAKKSDISVQTAVRTGGATNGAPIHISNMGVPSIVIGVPVRYAHTHYGISSYSDYKGAVDLAVNILKTITPEIIASF